VSFDVTVVLQIDVLWYVMLCSWVSSSHFRGLYCLPLQVQAVQEDLNLSIEVICMKPVCVLLANMACHR
jgi:hypothetical protein